MKSPTFRRACLGTSPALLAAALVLTTLASGCAAAAGPQDPVPRTAADPDADEPVFSGPTSTESEIGGLSFEDVDRQFQELQGRLLGCVHDSADRFGFIGGRVALRMRVDRRGNVRWAYLSDTTLGDRDAERCVLEVVKSRTWPRPLSGEGLAETSFDVEPADEPSALPAHKGSLLAQRASALTRQCRKGLSGDFRATAYVGSKGELLTVGVSPPDEAGETASDCIVDALRDVRVGNLGASLRAPAKVSFRLR